MKRFLGITIALLALNLLSGCHHGCGDRPRLFDRGRDREGPLERLRERRQDDDYGRGRGGECDDCHRPVSRNGSPGLGMPVSNGGVMPYMPGGYNVVPGSGFTNDPRELPNPMPTIPSPGVPEGPAAQPFPAGPNSMLPMPSTGPGRAVSK